MKSEIVLAGLSIALSISGAARAITLPGPSATISAGGGEDYYACGPSQGVSCAAMDTVTYNGVYAQGPATASFSLGANPSVSISSNYEPHDGTAGSDDSAQLSYYVEYCTNPTCNASTTPATVNVDVHYSAALDETLIVPGPGGPPPTGVIGPYGQVYLGLEAVNGPSAVSETTCFDTCPEGLGSSALALGPQEEIANVPLYVDTLYQLSIVVDRESIGGLNAEVDPFLTTSSTTGQFFFSPGIGAAPEPATWAMMLIGVAGVGAALRGVRRDSAAAPSAGRLRSS